MTAERRNVTVGQVIGNQTVIDKGIADGEKVVTVGQLRLDNGTKVEINPANVGGSATEEIDGAPSAAGAPS
jgi:membrane fusion protein, multidrug efflux system